MFATPTPSSSPASSEVASSSERLTATSFRSVISSCLRRRFGIEEGPLLIAEGREEGILLRPALAVPLESYSPERKAEFYSQTP